MSCERPGAEGQGEGQEVLGGLEGRTILEAQEVLEGPEGRAALEVQEVLEGLEAPEGLVVLEEAQETRKARGPGVHVRSSGIGRRGPPQYRAYYAVPPVTQRHAFSWRDVTARR
jgi:hypothetical protein